LFDDKRYDAAIFFEESNQANDIQTSKILLQHCKKVPEFTVLLRNVNL